jgi:hypothetical protein
LEEDINRRIKSIHRDREYKEQHEALDNQALEKQIDEALIPKEGEEVLDEDAKGFLARKLKFQILTKGFFVHHEAGKHHEGKHGQKH